MSQRSDRKMGLFAGSVIGYGRGVLSLPIGFVLGHVLLYRVGYRGPDVVARFLSCTLCLGLPGALSGAVVGAVLGLIVAAASRDRERGRKIAKQALIRAGVLGLLV